MFVKRYKFLVESLRVTINFYMQSRDFELYRFEMLEETAGFSRNHITFSGSSTETGIYTHKVTNFCVNGNSRPSIFSSNVWATSNFKVLKATYRQQKLVQFDSSARKHSSAKLRIPRYRCYRSATNKLSSYIATFLSFSRLKLI